MKMSKSNNNPNIDSSNDTIEYYRSIWNRKCDAAKVDEQTRNYFDYINNEVVWAQEKSSKNKKNWHKIEMLTIVFATCNTIFAALINFDGITGTIFKVLTIIASSLVSAIASYNALKKPKETWMRHSANCLALDIETLCFCNGSFCYEGKTDEESIKVYKERTALIKLNNYENFFSNMGYVKFYSDFPSVYKKEN